MTDILDTLDDLGDDFEDVSAVDSGDDSESTVLEGELIEFDDESSLEDYEMNEDQAREVTDAIRSAAAATYVLLRTAHQHKAHKALGYDTWEDYVRAEFDMSAQRSYQLLHLDKVVGMIEGATPEGTEVKLTEKQARDIKRELPRITERIHDETLEMSPEDAAARAEEILREEQAEVKAQQKAEKKAQEAKEKAAEDADREEHEQSLENAADALLEADRPEGMTGSADDGLLEMEVEGGEDESDSSVDLYNFFNILSSLGSMPAPDEFVNKIPESRKDEVDEQLMEATAWLNRLVTLWEMRMEQSDDE